MATLKLTTDNHSSSISVPSWFIHDYMPHAMGGYVKVYLYLLTAYYERTELLTIEDTLYSLYLDYKQKMTTETKQAHPLKLMLKD